MKNTPTKPMIGLLILIIIGGIIAMSQNGVFAAEVPKPVVLKAIPLCQVTVCNKISRFSIDPFTHLKDSMGKTCFDVVIPKSEAVVGRTLSSESRWWQGSTINPTKRSVTTISSVGACDP